MNENRNTDIGSYDKYSVLMSVYHREEVKNLKEAMDSIWNQTFPTDNFVLVCDGLLNEELNCLIDNMESEHPQTLSVVRLQKNVGLGNALNRGLEYCRNELVARMDSDDIACPDRCETQVYVFAQHPEIGICSGTVIEFIDKTENEIGKRMVPVTHEEIVSFSKRRNPFNHPAVMFKKSAVEAAGGYDESFHLFEDYYLWIRMLQNHIRGYNVKEPLLYMRSSKELYLRRGGNSYTKDMLRFHRWMLHSGWSDWKDFAFGAVPHAVVCLLPNYIRESIYKRIHT